MTPQFGSVTDYVSELFDDVFPTLIALFTGEELSVSLESINDDLTLRLLQSMLNIEMIVSGYSFCICEGHQTKIVSIRCGLKLLYP